MKTYSLLVDGKSVMDSDNSTEIGDEFDMRLFAGVDRDRMKICLNNTQPCDDDSCINTAPALQKGIKMKEKVKHWFADKHAIRDGHDKIVASLHDICPDEPKETTPTYESDLIVKAVNYYIDNVLNVEC